MSVRFEFLLGPISPQRTWTAGVSVPPDAYTVL